MNKSLKFLVIAAVWTLQSAVIFAQNKVKLDWYCSFYGEQLTDDVYEFSSDSEAQEAVKRIVNYTGLTPNFTIRAANVPNALATIEGEQRVILYNQQFMHKVKDSTRTDWAATSIIAHEIGHHLQGHTMQRTGSRPKLELEADRYSGFILQRMGASVEQAQAAMQNSSANGSTTHPPRSARLAAIMNGWKAAYDLSRSGPDISKPPKEEPRKQNAQGPASTNGNSIPANSGSAGNTHLIARCVFDGDPIAYYVTSTDDIIGVTLSGPTIVGKKMPSSYPNQFAWMYVTAYIIYGVGYDGIIYNRTPYGRVFRIGYVTAAR